jgi:hypothetical protein
MALISPGETMRNPETGIAEGALVAHWQVKDLKVSKILELLISCLQTTDLAMWSRGVLRSQYRPHFPFQSRLCGQARCAG